MSQKMRIYQWISYFIVMLVISVIGGLFMIKAQDYSYYDNEGLITPLFVYIIIFLMGISLFINNLRCLHNHPASFYYLETEVMPHLPITHQEHQKAIELYEKYMFKAYIIHSLLKILIICLGICAIFVIDLLVFIYNSPLIFFILTLLLTCISCFTILIITNLIIEKIYKKYAITMLNQNSLIFIDFSYIYLCHDYASLPCPFSYKMNIATGLSRLGEYSYANIYLKRLWNEEKRQTKNTVFQLIYYYNCYIFSLRLHLDNASQYRDKVHHIFLKHPRLKKAKSTQYISMRIQIEEAFSNEEWENVIIGIEKLYSTDTQLKTQAYYAFLLYVAYLHTNNEKANDIYKQYKDHIHFQKLIELENKAID